VLIVNVVMSSDLEMSIGMAVKETNLKQMNKKNQRNIYNLTQPLVTLDSSTTVEKKQITEVTLT